MTLLGHTARQTSNLEPRNFLLCNNYIQFCDLVCHYLVRHLSDHLLSLFTLNIAVHNITNTLQTCCVFWPAFGCCAHPKAGQNNVLAVFRLFSSCQPLQDVYYWFFIESKNNVWKILPQFFKLASWFWWQP